MSSESQPEIQQLSEREREILSLVANGLSNQQIAHRLGISVNTVKVHLRNVFSKIGAASRTEASMYAVRTGIVTVDRAAPADAAMASVAAPPLAAAENSPGLESDVSAPSHEHASSEVEAPSIADDASAVVASLTPLEAESRPLAAHHQAVVPSPAAPPVATHGVQRRWPVALVAVAVVILMIGGLAWSLNHSATMTASSDQPAATAAARWRQLPDMPEPRAAFAAVAFEDRIYVVGGENADGVLDSVLRFDASSTTWTKLSSKPTAVTDVRAVALGGKLYVPGGRLSDDPTDVTDRFERYDLRAEQWETLPALPAPRSGYALATLDGRLYVIGGWDGSTFRREVFEYDPERESWQQRADMPTARAFASVGVIEDRIFVFGGENERGPLANNEVYTPALEASDPWSRRAPLPQPRSRFGAAVALSSVILLGGHAGLPPARYNVLTDSWETLESSPEPLGEQPGVVLMEGMIYVLGGRFGMLDYSARMQGYQAVYTQFLPQ